jgi:hypothetical protein
MPFSISGRIAGGMDEALEQVLDRRLKEAIRQDQERQRVAENLQREQGLDLQRQTLAGAAEDRKADNARQQQLVDLQLRKDAAAEAEKATNANRASDIAGVLNMPGMSNEAKSQEIGGLAVKTGMDPRYVIENLQPKSKKYTPPLKTAGGEYVQYEEGQIPPGTRFYEEPKTPSSAKQDYEWVTGPDGTPRQIPKGTAGAGERPYDPVFERGKAKTEIVHPQLIKYSENLIRKIDDLIGRDDDPSTPENEKKDTRISQWTTGVGGAAMRMLPWNTEAKDVDAELFSLTSELAIAALQKMRASSATGGAVGNVALGEMEIMKNAEAAIRADQSPRNLQRQLGIIRDSERKFLQAVQQDAQENAKTSGITVKPGGGPPTGRKETPAEIIKRLGGG